MKKRKAARKSSRKNSRFGWDAFALAMILALTLAATVGTPVALTWKTSDVRASFDEARADAYRGIASMPKQ